MKMRDTQAAVTSIAVFDIDGTLLDSSDVDFKLYMESVQAVLGDVEFRDDWAAYEHVSDLGILRSIIRDNGLSHEAALIAQVKRVFVQSMDDYLQTHGPFNEVPGALDFVRALRRSSDTDVAYATGGWKATATLKLQASGFPLDDLPLATSDEYEDRVSIMRSAVSALSQPVSGITYYGDGIWDQLACEQLGWNFVAVGKRLGGIEAFEPIA